MSRIYYCKQCGKRLERVPECDEYSRTSGKILLLAYMCVEDSRAGHDWYLVNVKTGKIIE